MAGQSESSRDGGGGDCLETKLLTVLIRDAVGPVDQSASSHDGQCVEWPRWLWRLRPDARRTALKLALTLRPIPGWRQAGRGRDPGRDRRGGARREDCGCGLRSGEPAADGPPSITPDPPCGDLAAAPAPPASRLLALVDALVQEPPPPPAGRSAYRLGAAESGWKLCFGLASAHHGNFSGK